MAKKMLTTGVLGTLMHAQKNAETAQSDIEAAFTRTFKDRMWDGSVKLVVDFFCDLEAALAAADMKRLPSEQVSELNLEAWTTGVRKNQTSKLRKAIKAGATFNSMDDLFWKKEGLGIRSIAGLADLWMTENRPPEEEDAEVLQEAATALGEGDATKTEPKQEPIQPAEIAAQIVKDFSLEFALQVAEEIARLAENAGKTEQSIILDAIAEVSEESAAA